MCYHGWELNPEPLDSQARILTAIPPQVSTSHASSEFAGVQNKLKYTNNIIVRTSYKIDQLMTSQSAETQDDEMKRLDFCP